LDWWSLGDEGIKQGIDYYNEGVAPSSLQNTYNDLAELAQGRMPPYLTLEEVQQVLRFKTSPGRRERATAALGVRGDVAQVTQGAYARALEGDLPTALRSLDALPWVGVPTASAILTAMNPQLFAIIDRYAVTEIAYLSHARLFTGDPDPVFRRLAETVPLWAWGYWYQAYARYIDGLQAKLAASEGFSARDIEKALFGHFLHRKDLHTR
jgi:hypothetical protein